MAWRPEAGTRPAARRPALASSPWQGNTLAFTGVEPLVVHGLPDFEVVTPDDPADLVIDTVNVVDLNLSNLTLHVLTLDGVVSWRQQQQLMIDEAPDARRFSTSLAINGDTLVVGADLYSDDLSTTLPYGSSLRLRLERWQLGRAGQTLPTRSHRGRAGFWTSGRYRR